jgi:hypothetical protein
MPFHARAMTLWLWVTRAPTFRRGIWLLPYVLVWALAFLVLRAGALSAECTTVCMVARGWLWYTVLYATLSLSAFVGAFELLIWMSRLGPTERPKVRAPNN